MPVLKRERRKRKLNKPAVVVNALVILLLLLPAAGSWSWYDIPFPNESATIHECFCFDTYATYEWYASADDGTSTTQSDYCGYEERLQQHVKSVPYNTSDYELGEFDCTNMAAMTHDYLERLGYDVKVVKGVNGGYRDNHAWLLVGEVDNILHTSEGTSITISEDSYWIETRYKSVISYNLSKSLYKKVEVYEDYNNTGWPMSEWEY